MSDLRTLSARPIVIVDQNARSTGVGIPGPLGRGRVLSALPMNRSTIVTLSAPRIVAGDFLVADPQGNVLGTRNRVTVHRMLYATRTINTRRL